MLEKAPRRSRGYPPPLAQHVGGRPTLPGQPADPLNELDFDPLLSNFRECGLGEVVRRITLPRTRVNKGTKRRAEAVTTPRLKTVLSRLSCQERADVYHLPSALQYAQLTPDVIRWGEGERSPPHFKYALPRDDQDVVSGNVHQPVAVGQRRHAPHAPSANRHLVLRLVHVGYDTATTGRWEDQHEVLPGHINKPKVAHLLKEHREIARPFYRRGGGLLGLGRRSLSSIG